MAAKRMGTHARRLVRSADRRSAPLGRALGRALGSIFFLRRPAIDSSILGFRGRHGHRLDRCNLLGSVLTDESDAHRVALRLHRRGVDLGLLVDVVTELVLRGEAVAG